MTTPQSPELHEIPCIIQSAFHLDGGKGQRIIIYTGSQGITTYGCDDNWQPYKKPYCTMPAGANEFTDWTNYHIGLRLRHKPEDFVPEHSTPIPQPSLTPTSEREKEQEEQSKVELSSIYKLAHKYNFDDFCNFMSIQPSKTVQPEKEKNEIKEGTEVVIEDINSKPLKIRTDEVNIWYDFLSGKGKTACDIACYLTRIAPDINVTSKEGEIPSENIYNALELASEKCGKAERTEPGRTNESLKQRILQIIIGNIGITDTGPSQQITGLEDAASIIADFVEGYRREGLPTITDEEIMIYFNNHSISHINLLKDVPVMTRSIVIGMCKWILDKAKEERQ